VGLPAEVPVLIDAAVVQGWQGAAMAEGEGAGRVHAAPDPRLSTVRERLSALRAGTEELVPRIGDIAAMERDSAVASMFDLVRQLGIVEEELGDLVRAAGDLDDPRVPPASVLFADAPLPYLVTDTHGVILAANEAAGVLLARRPDELPRVPIAGFSGPPPGALRRVVTVAAASATPRSALLSLRSPHRSPRQVRATVQRLDTGASDPVLLWQLHPAPKAEPVPLARPVPPARAASPEDRPPPEWAVPADGSAVAGRSVPPERDAAAGRSPPVDRPPEDRDALAGAVLELASALVSDLDLPDALRRVAVIAMHGVPGAVGASVTLLEPPSSGASDDRVEQADRVQFDEQDGPAVAAVLAGHTVVADDVGTDPRWVTGGPRVVVESGFRAVVAVPLTDGREVLGALALYAVTPGTFGPAAVAGVELLAAPVEAHVVDLRAYRTSLHVAEELRRGLVTRAVIDQAKGILMVQHGITADQAFAVLTRFSQQENRKLRNVAADLVESAVRGGGRPGQS
jgi:PAS domain-containing protein